jgi:hypothetical protein
MALDADDVFHGARERSSMDPHLLHGAPSSKSVVLAQFGVWV